MVQASKPRTRPVPVAKAAAILAKLRREKPARYAALIAQIESDLKEAERQI